MLLHYARRCSFSRRGKAMSDIQGLPEGWTDRRAFYMSSGRTHEDRQRGDALCAAVATVIENLNLDLKVETWFDEQGPGAISISIAESILNAPVVFADLTGSNLNVYYEVGVAHATEVPVICFQQKGDRTPFDLADQRSIPVRFEEGKLQDPSNVRAVLQQALHRVMRPSGTPATAVAVVRLAWQHRALLEEISDLREELRGRDHTDPSTAGDSDQSRSRESRLLVSLAQEERLDRATAETLEAGRDVVDLRDGRGRVIDTRDSGSQLTVRIRFVNGVIRTFEVTDHTRLYLVPLDTLLDERPPPSP
ncbi:MAG: hypothetical protein LC808_43205 [Actinobacteria bacterium]|nr:hypothetical protein [Actinomycetota bacterium]